MLSDKFQDNCSAVVLAGVIGQQGMITPSWHLTHLWYIQGCVFAMHSFMYFLFIQEIDTGSLSLPFHLV